MRLLRHRRGCENTAPCTWCGRSLKTDLDLHWEDMDVPDKPHSAGSTIQYYCNVCALLMQTDDGALLRTLVAVVVGT